MLQIITGCRGAMSGLLAVVLKDHVRTHLVDAQTNSEHGSGTERLIEVVQQLLQTEAEMSDFRNTAFGAGHNHIFLGAAHEQNATPDLDGDCAV